MIDQGTKLNKKEMVVLILSEEDIIETFKDEHNRKPTKKELSNIWEVSQRKFSDCIMEDFWLVLRSIVRGDID